MIRKTYWCSLVGLAILTTTIQASDTPLEDCKDTGALFRIIPFYGSHCKPTQKQSPIEAADHEYVSTQAPDSVFREADTAQIASDKLTLSEEVMRQESNTPSTSTQIDQVKGYQSISGK